MFLTLSLLILVTNALDVGYTIYAIARYGMREWNGLWKWCAKNPAVFFIASMLFHGMALLALGLWRCPAWVLGIGLFARVVVCVRNVNVVKGRRQR